MYRTESIERYLADASAMQPTPGGGSASALAGATGAAMACMAANFTVGNKKFESVRPRVEELLARCNAARTTLLELVDADVAAYAHVARAYSMPRTTADEKAARTAAIQSALSEAMAPPLRTFVVCADVIDALVELADLANPNLVSDVGVAAALALGALEGAQLNVEVNLAGLKADAVVTATRETLERTGPRAREAARKVLDKVYGQLRQ